MFGWSLNYFREICVIMQAYLGLLERYVFFSQFYQHLNWIHFGNIMTSRVYFSLFVSKSTNSCFTGWVWIVLEIYLGFVLLFLKFFQCLPSSLTRIGADLCFLQVVSSLPHLWICVWFTLEAVGCFPPSRVVLRLKQTLHER